MDDITRFITHLEDVFCISLDDKCLVQIRTPSELINHLASRLPISTNDYQIWDRIYNKLADFLSSRTNVSASKIEPDSCLKDIMPDGERINIWKEAQVSFQATYWPQIDVGRKRFSTFDAPLCRTIGQVVDFLVARFPALGHESEGWTKNQISEVVRLLIIEDFGIPAADYTDNANFVDGWLID